MKNIVQLAKMFSQFIELESSFVRVEDIKAIRKRFVPGVGGTVSKSEGIEVVTPYGVFHDSTDFDSFKEKIQIVLETLKMNEMSSPALMEQPRQRIVELPNPTKNESDSVPVDNSVEEEEATIKLFGNGASGTLFDDPGYKVVNRKMIRVMSPDGVVISKGDDNGGGTVVGDEISGIVYESGRYTIAAKNYNGDTIIIKYQIQRR